MVWIKSFIHWCANISDEITAINIVLFIYISGTLEELRRTSRMAAPTIVLIENEKDIKQ